MIYLDNAATTLQKPPAVEFAVCEAIRHFGNAGRAFHEPALLANHAVFEARSELAELFHACSANNIAFSSSATESINLVTRTVLEKGAHVLTTCYEHNSVLRPLYNLDCELSWLNPDENGKWGADAVGKCLRDDPTIEAFFCTHGSNVTGDVLPVQDWYSICRDNNVLFVLDVSQTAGAIPVRADMADFLCFTGHKALFGPQGTGGIVCEDDHLIQCIVKTGGTGDHSFDPLQPMCMPDCFEAGTMNAHGLAGLAAGISFIHETNLAKIMQKEQLLTDAFISGVEKISNLTLYKSSSQEQLPVCALAMEGLSSAELSLCLWEEFSIATRAGIHCAPKLHEYLHTEKAGLTRFSFSYFTTMDDIDKALEALMIISQRLS